MGTHMMAFLIIIIVNILLVAAYLLWNLLIHRKEHWKGYVARGIVMFLCPIVGVGFFGLSHLFHKVFFSEPVDLEDVVFSKERVRSIVHSDEDNERNMVPLEEAIEITETDSLRTLMMNIVRGDISKSLTAIALALNSEDTETAHYAASVLQDALNEFRSTVQKDYNLAASDDEASIPCAGALIDYMNAVLEQKVLSDIEQEAYVKIMADVCEILYDKDRDQMSSSRYEAICLRLLEVSFYEKSEMWCLRAKQQYPNTLSTYTCQMKLYFNSGKKEDFFRTVDDLRNSDVVIDRETLELIRIFQE